MYAQAAPLLLIALSASLMFIAVALNEYGKMK